MTETYVEAETSHRWRDPVGIWRAFVCFYLLAIMMYAIFAGYGGLVLLHAEYWLPAEIAVAIDAVIPFLNALIWPLFATCAVVTLVLHYVLTANAHALGAETRLSSPLLAIAGYFIPIVSLFMPPAMVGQLWRATFGPTGQQPNGVIALWWSAFVVAAIIGSWASITENVNGPADTITLFKGQTLGFIARIIAASSLLYIFGSVVRQQRATNQSRSGDM